MFESWLADTDELQAAFGVSPSELEGEAAADYLRWNVLAAITELTELLQETRWKPWQPDQGVPGETLGAARIEFVDALHFCANIGRLLKLDDKTLSEIYRAKMDVNRRRLATGQNVPNGARSGGTSG